MLRVRHAAHAAQAGTAAVTPCLRGGADFAAEAALLAQVPLKCAGVPDEILNPKNQWSNKGEFDKTLAHLADLYQASLFSFACKHPDWP